MRPHHLIFTLSLGLTACTVPDTTKGTVHQFNGNTVTIRGTFATDGSPARPTPAMIEQAQKVCKDAQYLSATPSNINEYDMNFLYLFKC